MRFRVQSQAPLPEIKAWFIPDVPDSPDTIHELKGVMCRRIPALKAANYLAEDLVLVLDDFELLDDSPFSAVRDGDLIRIKKATQNHIPMDDYGKEETHHPVQRKRKRSPEVNKIKPLSIPKPVMKTLASVLDEESPSSSSTSGSSPSSDTDSDSSTSSASSSASSSSSGGSSSSPPKVLSSKNSVQLPASASQQPHVPPGYGKAATHARNQRRKKRRELLKLATISPSNQNPAPIGSSEANSLPLGEKKPNEKVASQSQIPQQPTSYTAGSSTPVYITQEQVMMSSLRNKNKKKGFKLSMSNPIPQKIVFANRSSALASADKVIEKNMDVDAITNVGLSEPYARLIPPSEIQELGHLPPNMFVTSVDVEAGIWGVDSHLSSSKKSKRNNKTKQAADDSLYEVQDESIEDTDIMLPYEDIPNDVQVVDPQFDWNKVEKEWEVGTLITEKSQVIANAIVGWKTLAIDPQTFTPAYVLHAAQIIKAPLDSGQVIIKMKDRSHTSETAIAFGLSSSSEESKEEAVEWDDVLGEQWKLLNL